MFGWDKALYSIIFQYASTQMIHWLYRKYQQGTLFIVTNRPREICDAISAVSHHGATILEGEGSLVDAEGNVLDKVLPGQATLCPKGESHSLANRGDSDLLFFAVVTSV